MYKFRIVEKESIPWNMIESCYDHTIYKSQAWVSHLANNYGVCPYILEVYSNDDLVGYFIGEKFKKIITIIAAPFEGWQTPFQGLSMLLPITIQQRLEIYKSIEDYLIKNKECTYFQAADFLLDLEDVVHSKIRYEIIEGYMLDLTLSLEDLYKNMGNSAKNPIKAAKNRGIVIQTPTKIDNFISSYYEQLIDAFSKQHLKPTHDIKDIKAQIYSMLEADKILLLEAVSKDGIPLASTFFIYDNNIAFWLGAASNSKYQKLSPNEPLMFEALKRLKQIGIKKLEMGGGRKYKEKYGPTSYNKPRIIASKYPGIIEFKSIAKKTYYGFREFIANVKKMLSN